MLQIEEAHSEAWKVGLDHHPKNHDSMQSRMDRAKEFVDAENPPYDTYVDIFPDNIAEKELQLWPDVYYLFDKEFNVIQKSEYNRGGKKDATVIEDSTDLIIRI